MKMKKSLCLALTLLLVLFASAAMAANRVLTMEQGRITNDRLL